MTAPQEALNPEPSSKGEAMDVQPNAQAVQRGETPTTSTPSFGLWPGMDAELLRMEGSLHRGRERPITLVGGRVTGATGAMLRATLPAPGLGHTVRLVGTPWDQWRNPPPLGGLAQVLSFDGNHAFLAPLEPLQAGLTPGCRVIPCSPCLQVTVGHGLLGRMVDGLGRPMDNSGPLVGPLMQVDAQSPPPSPLSRHRLIHPFHSGIRTIDTLTPLVQGQRLALFAPAGVGKTTLIASLTSAPNLKTVVLCLVGERGREVRQLVEGNLTPEARSRTVVVCSTADHPAMARASCVDTATAIAEHFRNQGENVLLLIDSLTRYARALRELALAAGEPQGRRGYPASVAARLAPLIERAGPGPQGSITAVYSVLVEDRMEDDPLGEEIRSLVDGHLVLSPTLANRGIFPAIDPVRSLSRMAAGLASTSHQAAANHFRDLWGHLEDKWDLVAMGAYVSGTDPLLDEALEKRSAMEAYLCQPKTLLEDPQRAREQLVQEFTPHAPTH